MTMFWTKERFARFQSLLALALLVTALSLMRPDSFLTVENGLNVFRQISINLCLSIGMTMIIISGGIDLSVGSVLALAGVVSAGLLKNGIDLPYWGVSIQFTFLGAVVAGILTGLLCGWFNGLAITKLRVPPFVATLGMLSIARGLTMLWSNHYPITNLGDEFEFVGRGRFLGIPTPVWVAGVLVAIFALVMRRTRFGRHLYAVGGNERTALLSGLNVHRIKLAVYTIGGGLAGVAGLVSAGRVNAADPKVGVGFELDSIAAVVIGGTSLSGGRGSILGTVLGCLIIGVLNNGLGIVGVSPDWQLVIKGLVIVAAVAIDQAGRRSD